ncbi:uncharacterized protein MYCFIDRAFT_170510 [Pseudocercospora fijiensis CIRAD86]|uniref:Uncharacterized protein n=1 Tax=Pseudocercospora fijiensis (strain CIRAD86) TaxID=383855 RepID=N1QC53_PSEFD|nr:uncharacterized protein MYCFIDRAFT_170510 [Pseudocercospora fijiensis CIRAD86]EME88957.1 hypothetical protein MYCFIDRAFT_170510 [Pseudocercospora fijiensis CIRAD86]
MSMGGIERSGGDIGWTWSGQVEQGRSRNNCGLKLACQPAPQSSHLLPHNLHSIYPALHLRGPAFSTSLCAPWQWRMSSRSFLSSFAHMEINVSICQRRWIVQLGDYLFASQTVELRTWFSSFPTVRDDKSFGMMAYWDNPFHNYNYSYVNVAVDHMEKSCKCYASQRSQSLGNGMIMQSTIHCVRAPDPP